MMISRTPHPRIAFGAFLLICLAPWNLFAQVGRGTVGGEDRFVSVGTLRDHGKSRSGSPRYALFDNRGSIVAYVASRRDMDLTQYLNQEVGITAKSVSFGSAKTPYVLAEQVTRLEPASRSTTPRSEANRATGSGVELVNFDDPLRMNAHEVVPAGGAYVTQGPVPPIVAAAPLEPIVAGPEHIHAGGGCNQCGHQCSATPASSCSGGSCAACPCGRPHRIWVRPEYLLWWSKGMDIPPLVTTSTITTDGAGALNVPGTSILYGNSDILDGSRSGFRLRGGLWLDRCQWWGIEGEWLKLGDESDSFTASSDGSTLLARPFFNINPFGLDENLVGGPDPPAREDAQLVAAPGILAGTVTVNSDTDLSGFGFRGRFNVCCENYSCNDGCGGGGFLGSSRVDVLVGYRHLKLRDSLTINENLTDLNPPPGVNSINTLITDRFSTENEFHGPEVGIQWETHRRRFFLELLGKVALGNNHQTVQIDGSTTRIVNGVVTPQLTGGLLAQTTNIGTYERDVFSVIPELGATLGFHITPRLMLTGGYSFIYWSPVVRAGDQIDLDVNEQLLPPPVDPLTGAARPAFAWNESDFWVQGVNFGLDYRW